MENKAGNGESGVIELIKYAVIAAIIVVPFRIFIAQPYIVEGSSMVPTFQNGDYLIVDQISSRFEKPERGAVIIMRYPKDPSKFFIKRLIGFPGETVHIKSGKVYIQTSTSTSEFLLDEPYVKFAKGDNFEMKLENDQYFVMGDNRAGSSDSRAWGPLPGENIVGRPLVRLLPIKSLDLWPGVTKTK